MIIFRYPFHIFEIMSEFKFTIITRKIQFLILQIIITRKFKNLKFIKLLILIFFTNNKKIKTHIFSFLNPHNTQTKFENLNYN